MASGGGEPFGGRAVLELDSDRKDGREQSEEHQHQREEARQQIIAIIGVRIEKDVFFKIDWHHLVVGFRFGQSLFHQRLQLDAGRKSRGDSQNILVQ